MLQVKDWVLIAGLVLICIGYECLPHGQAADAQQNLSRFAQAADAGAFLSFGFLTLAAGVIIAVVSFLLPRK